MLRSFVCCLCLQVLVGWTAPVASHDSLVPDARLDAHYDGIKNDIGPGIDSFAISRYNVQVRRGLHNSKVGGTIDTKVAPASAKDWSVQAHQMMAIYGKLDPFGKATTLESVQAFNTRGREVFSSCGVQISREIKNPLDVYGVILGSYELLPPNGRAELQEAVKAVKRTINLQAERKGRNAALNRIADQFSQLAPQKQAAVQGAAATFVEHGTQYLQTNQGSGRRLASALSGSWIDTIARTITSVSLVSMTEAQRAVLKTDFDNFINAAE
ncbi:hypothetical protein FRB99_005788 [Tulasnella sp. 403]|nr:hypothetical protein FRB99_005788 [Tulasnella sp. 403]